MAVSTEKEEMIQGQVIRAARQLYQQHGLFKVTMEDVAKAVGKGKSSLYYYYKSKEEIFDAVIDAEIKEIFTEIVQAVSKADTTENKIRVYCRTRLYIARVRKMSFGTMDAGPNADEIASYNHTRETVRKKFMEAEHTHFKQILVTGIEKGEVRAIDDKELDMIVFVLMSSFRGLKQEIVEKNNNELEENAAKTIASLVINGLGA